MTCKFFMTEKYKEKIDEIFAEKNLFEVDTFKRSHEIVVINSVDEIDEMHDSDIVAIDDSTFDVFVEHLDCYFTT